MPTWRPPPSPPTPCSSRTAGARRCARSGGCWPRRDPHGTWSSTQATVLALRALLEAAGQSELSEAQGTLRVVGARGVKEVHFAPGQADVVQRVDLTDWLDAAGSPALRGRRPGQLQAAHLLSRPPGRGAAQRLFQDICLPPMIVAVDRKRRAR